MTKFYKFDQNNSGGGFDFDDQITHRLIIEAETEEQAIEIAEGMGVYFNGVVKGLDCECCGDRWHYPDEVNLPVKWSGDRTFETIEEYAQYLTDQWPWLSPDARIFFLDGTVKEFFKEEK